MAYQTKRCVGCILCNHHEVEHPHNLQSAPRTQQGHPYTRDFLLPPVRRISHRRAADNPQILQEPVVD